MKSIARIALLCFGIFISLAIQAQDSPVVFPPIWYGLDWNQGAIEACREDVQARTQALPPKINRISYISNCSSTRNHWVQTAWILLLSVRIEYVDENNDPQVFNGVIPGSNLPTCEHFYAGSGGNRDDVSGCQEVYYQSAFEDPLACPHGMVLNTQFVCVAQNLHSSNHDGCSVGNPINIMHGNKFEHIVDYVLPGPVPYEFSRTYNSINGGWTFSFDVGMHVTMFNTLEIGMPQFGLTAYRPDGTKWQLAPDATGRNLRSKHGVIRDFMFSGGVVKLEDYSSGTVETYGIDGARQLIQYPNGNTITALADTFYPTSSPTATNMTLITRVGGKPSIIQDALGDVKVRYYYNSEGNLSEVHYKGGRVIQYQYGDSNFSTALTGVQINGIQKSSWTYNQEGKAISSSRLNGTQIIDHHSIDYLIDNESSKVIESTNALGKKTKYYYQKENNESRLIQIEGIATDSCLPSNSIFTYYPNGDLATVTENGVTTKYEYNTDRRVIRKTEALGTNLERIITTEWHPTLSKMASTSDGITKTTFTYNSSGMLLNKKLTIENQ